MADTLGIPQNTYANYELGQRKTPREVLEKLSKLGLNLHWLTTGEGAMILPVKEVQPGHKGTYPVQGRVDAQDQDDTGDEAQAKDYGKAATRIVLAAIRKEGLEGVDRVTEDWLIDQYADGLSAGRSPRLLDERLGLALLLIRKYRLGTEPE